MANRPEDSISATATDVTLGARLSPATGAPDGQVRTVLASDGYELSYRVWPTADDAAAVGTIVLFNGIMSHSLWFRPLAAPLRAAGLKIVGADRRGSGMNRVARGDAPSAQVLLDDACAIIEIERLPGRPLHAAGWCWGAVLAINVAAELPRPPSRLMLLAPGLFPVEALKRRMAAEVEVAKTTARREDEACLASPIAEEMFTAGPALRSFIAPDAQKLTHVSPRFHAIMAKLGMGVRLKLPRLAVPSLVVLASRDAATDNAETTRGFTKLTGGRAVFETIDGAHGLQFDAPDRLAQVIAAFASRTGAAGPP